MDDWKLLREYAAQGSETAFRELVRRHVDMVHAAALRQLHDAHLAQDATQAVFILLARKAAALRPSVILSGWLYRTTAHVASRALRDRLRQQRREQEASMITSPEPVDELWEKLAPHLDAAIGALSTTDRDAVVLRFLQQRSFNEVGATLGVSEDAAKKRVSRALEKLRAHLTARGIGVSGVALAGTLGANACVAAPAAVLAAVSTTTSGAASPIASGLAGAVVREWFFAKVKLAAGVAVGTAAVVLLTMRAGIFQPSGPALPDAQSSVAALPANESPVLTAVAAPAAGIAPTTNSRTMRVRVVSSADRTALTEARAEIVFYGAKYVSARLTADADGAMLVTRPDRKFSGMAYWINAPGHVPKCVSWKNEEGFSLPEEYEIALDPGMRVSGKVVDETGQPVNSARLRFGGEGMQWNSREYVDYHYPPVVPTSDDVGEWNADFLAARPTISGYASHPDFAETEFRFQFTAGAATNLTITLSNGAAISGVVLDARLEPIKGATVRVDWQHSSREEIKVQTDDLGQFHFPHVVPGRLQVKTSAAGFHAAEQWHELTTTGLLLTNTLAPIKHPGTATVRGRVVDETGAPIASAWVQLSAGQPEFAGLNWSATTDDDGRFVWSHAPDNGALFNIGGWNYQSVQNVQLASGETEHQIFLRGGPTSTLKCIVTDQVSGKPIPRFRVMRGELDLTWHHSVDGLASLNFAGEGVNGSFACTWSRRNPLDRRPIVDVIRIEAEGYEPRNVTVTNATSQGAEVAVPLEPASAITGVVSTPAGSPAAGAAVAMLGGSMRVQMQSPARFLDYGPDPRQHRTRTATDGSFRLSSRREGTRIIVIHDTGFANLPLESAREGDIVLQPWGRIEGVIKVGSQPGANLELSAQATPGYPDGLAFYYRAKSDAAGRFVFEKVPTGQVDVSRSMLTPFSRDGTGLTASTQLRTVAVAAGQTTQVSLGGAGVQVRGRLVLQTPRPDAAIEQAAQNLRPANQVPDPTAVPRGYGFFCQPDGTFVIEDVPPGEYVLELRVNAVKDRNNPDSAFGFPIAKLDTPITIPENQTEPFDLGQFKVPPLR